MTTRMAAPYLNTNDDVLRAIIAAEIKPLFRRMHLSPDWIIGFIGDRGSGKSLSGGNTTIRDFGMRGATMWSNAKLKLTIDVDDDEAAPYGAKGGSISYEAKPIDRRALNNLDSRYENSCLFIDEINLFGSDAWRSMTNESLDRADLVQQLRKFHCGMVYTCIEEMFVINRIRDATDIFIKCSDTASSTSNLLRKKPQGHDFEWTIYAMTWRLAGAENTYKKTGKPLFTIPINLRKSWGIVDTDERQSRRLQREIIPVEMQENAEINAMRAQWGWLQDKVLLWRKMGRSSIEPGELPLMLGRPIVSNIRKALGMFGVSYDKYSQTYILNDFNLGNAETEKSR